MRFAIALTLAAATLATLTGCPPTPPPLSGQNLKGTRSLAYERAITTLLVHARDADPGTRANCIEALEPSDDPRARGVIEQGLNDKDAMVRFASAMSAGKRKDALVKPRLKEMAVGDVSTNVRVAAIYALYRVANYDHMQILVRTIESPDETVRANTYMVLGLMGNKDYVPLLASRKTKEVIPLQPRAKFELTAALARLGDVEATRVITGLVYSKVAEDQWNALSVCSDLPEQKVMNALLWCLNHELNIDKSPRNIQIRRQLIAARSLAKMNKFDGPKLAATFLEDPAPDVRALAALALGEALNPTGEPRIAPLLEDKEELVRIAAAAAVVNIWSRMADTSAQASINGGRLLQPD